MKIKIHSRWILSSAFATLFSSSVLAQQQSIPGSAATSVQSPPPSSSQPTYLGRDWVIRPRVSLTETLTDNVNISNGNNSKKNDLISELAPGIHIDARTARLKGYFDYALRTQNYAQTDRNRTQNSLNTFGTLEAIEKWLFFDFSGMISQQSISALGTQSPSAQNINNNSTETATYRFSPYIRGQIGGAVDYLLRYNLSTTHTRAANTSDVDLAEWVGQLSGGTPFNNLKWTLDANQQTADYSRGRETESERVRAMGTYSLFPQFKISLSGGWESNNYASLDKEQRNTHGYGFNWTPTERTRLSAFKERRFFGDGHDIAFTHRFPRSNIRFSDTRDVSFLPNQFATVGQGSLYELYYPVLANIEPYASMPPGVKESAIANAITNTFGLPSNTQVTSSFLTSRATLMRRQQLSLGMTGVRNTLTVMLSRSESQSILAAANISDDFSQNTSVKQQGISINLSHRLSEVSNLSATASRQESTGTGTTNLKTTMTSFNVSLSTKLGPKTTGALTGRRSEFDSTANPYTENAVLGTLSFVY